MECIYRDRTMKMANIIVGDQRRPLASSTVEFSCPAINWSSHVSLFQAQRYQELVDELHQNRLQMSLAELYRNEKGIGALSATLREKQQAAAAKNNKLVNGEQTVKTCKKEHGRLTREQQHVEKEIRCVCVCIYFLGAEFMECETVYLLFTFGNKHQGLCQQVCH